MIFRFSTVFVLIFVGSIVCSPLQAQPAKYSLDSLVKMPVEQFDRWLTDLTNSIEPLDFNLISSAVYERLSTGAGVSEKAITNFFAKSSSLAYVDKVALIDRIFMWIPENRLLNIELLNMKSLYIDNDSIPQDSVLLSTCLHLNQRVEDVSSALLKIQHRNYSDLGDLYLNVYNDKAKAEEYYIKVRRFPFYAQHGEDGYFYKNLYVHASIGQIKCRQNNLKALEELVFVPAGFPDIAPTYKNYIEAAGGKCKICDDAMRGNGMIIRSAPPPIQDRN